MLAALVWLGTAPLWAQRVQFPSMLAQDGSVYGGAAPPATAPLAPTAPLTPVTPPAGTTFAPPGTLNPSTITPPAVQTTPPAWDPYSAGAAQPYSPYAPSPYAPSPYSAAPAPYNPGAEPIYPDGMPSVLPDNWYQTAQAPLKFLQETRARAAWITPMGSQGSRLGVTDFDLSATFAIPIVFNQAPLLITPGAGYHSWAGPPYGGPGTADLPPNTYDMYVDAGWQPQITPWLSANVGVRTGLYTDFHAVNSQSIRIMGRGLGVVTLTPTLQVAAGVVYIDRVLIKILPAGGLIWTPNADARYEFLFPNPKLARRCRTIGTTDLWGYIAGEYGGGSWTIRRVSGISDQFDYNDIRVMFGLETFAQSGLHGLFELGYVFDRMLVYRSGDPSRFYPNSTIMMRAGLSY